MKVNTSKRTSFYTQGQQFVARVLFIVWLLASGSPESTLATPKRQPAIVPAPTTSPGDPSLVSTPPTPTPGGTLQLPPDSPGSFWDGSVVSTLAIDAAPQRPSNLSPRTQGKLPSRLASPGLQATPRTPDAPVAKSVTEGSSASAQTPLQARIAQGGIASTEALVAALNSTQDPQERVVLEEWLAAYIGHFRCQSVQKLVNNDSVCLLEYNQLANIQPSSDRTKELLLSYFVELSRKIDQEAHLHHALPLMESLVYALNKLDMQVFGNNSAPLIDLANQLLARVDPEQVVFSASGYPTHGTTLDALHQVLYLVSCIDPSLDSMDKNGIYQRFKTQLAAIDQAAQQQQHYPTSYHTQLLRQSLASLELNKENARLHDIVRRTFAGIQGLGHAYKGIKALVTLDVEMDALQAAYECFKQALVSDRVARQPWYTTHQAFRLSSFLSLRAQDPVYAYSYYTHFEHYLDEYLGRRVSRWQKLLNQAGRKSLRYGIVQHLVELALQSSTPLVRQGSIRHLSALVAPAVWGKKADVITALLDGLADVAVYEGIDAQERSMAHRALADVLSGASAGEEVTAWLDGQSIDKKLASRPVSSSRPASRELFEAVQRKIVRGFKPEVDHTPVLARLTDLERRLARIPSASDHHRLAEQIIAHAMLSQPYARGPQDVRKLPLDNDPAFRELLSKIESLEKEVIQGANSDGIEERLESLQEQLKQLQAVLAEGLSSAAPIAPEERQGIRARLVSHYSGTDFPYVKSLFDEHRSKHVKDLECQLMLREKKLVKDDKDDKKEEVGGSSQEDQVASHHVRLEEVKTPIDLQDLFKKRKIKPEPDAPEEEIHRILLTGDPGTGKTTLSKKLTYQWAAGTWGQEFHTLYLLPVRSLPQSEYDGTRYNREKTLSTAIVNNCFSHDLPTTEAEYNRLRDHIEQELEQPTTLVILDGLDERAGASEEILRQTQAGSYKLLLLSRPYGIDAEQRLTDIEIDHTGFNDEQLEAYVLAEVPDGKLAEELLGYIGKHENIRSIAHIPVNLQILCALWQDEDYGVKKEGLQQGSLPGLYRLFTEFTWQRYTKKWKLEEEHEEELFDTLGQIALAALEQGEVLISPGLVHQYVKQDKVKAKLKDAGFLLLSYVGQDQEKQGDPAKDSGFYQFPHLTFQEYFAGRALAQQFLSKDEDGQELVNNFLSEHKYESQYARTLSFMAGEVSRVRGVRGIQQLLGLLGEVQEVIGLQHLLLQLRVIHEWLCIASDQEAERGISMLEELGVIASLEAWFSRWMALMRKGWGTVEHAAGKQLLETLVQALSRIGAVLAPTILSPLHKATKDQDWRVRHAAVKALASLTTLDPASLTLLRKATKDQDRDVRLAAVQALQSLEIIDSESLTVLLKATKDQDEYVRHAAVQALRSFKALNSESLTVLRKATKDEDSDVRKAAVSALANLETTDPASLTLLREATKDQDRNVRHIAVKALASLETLDPASLTVLLKATEDEDEDVRHAAVQALASLKTIDPESLTVLREATKDWDWLVRHAAVEALASLKTLDPASLTVLREATKDQAGHVRLAAVQALQNLETIDPASLTVLLKATKDEDWRVRKAAVKALGGLKAIDPESLTLLRKAIKDQDSNVRHAAVKALGGLKAIDPESLTLLRQATKDQAGHVRLAAVQALQNLETTDPESLTVLRKATKDQDWRVRKAVVQALLSLKIIDPESLTVLLRATKDQNEDVRHAAVQALQNLETTDPASLTVLLKATEDQDSDVRKAAVKALQNLETTDPASLTVLLKATEDQDSDVRKAAVKALRSLKAIDPASLTVLCKATEDQDWRVRKAAARTLANLKATDPASLTVLCKATKDPDHDVRHAAVQALASLKIIDPASSTVLSKATKDQDSDVRHAAVQALGKLKTIDPASLTVLREATKDQDSDVRHAAARALGNLKTVDPASLTVLHEAAKDQDLLVRHAAVAALGNLKTTDPASLTVLCKTTKDEDEDVRHAAVAALGNLKTTDPTFLTVLRKATKDQVWTVRRAAVWALASLEVIDPASLTVLHEATKDQVWTVRKAAVKALGGLKAIDPESLTLLRKAIKDQDSNVRHAAVKALGGLKAIDPESLTLLRKATKDQDRDVREAAVEALANLKAIDPASLTVLRKATKDQDSGVSQAAVRAFQNLETIEPASLTVLGKATKDQDSDVRHAAVQALRNLETIDPESLILLHKATKDQDNNVRHAAVHALQNLKTTDPASLTVLREATKDQDRDVRHAAAEALQSLKTIDPASLILLHEATKDQDNNVRHAAAEALQSLKTIDPASLTVLHNDTKDQDWHIRQAAVEALGNLKAIDPESLTVLREAAKDQDRDVRKATVEALGNLKTLDPESLTVLRKATKDQDWHVRRAAVEALGNLKTLDPASLTVLRKATKDQDERVRYAAVWALQNLEAIDPASLTVLRKATKGQYGRVAAVEALAKLSTEQYIDDYWATKDQQLVPYIAYRLYQTPLVIDQRQATLYLPAGQRKTWPQPGQTITREEMEYFKQLIQRAAQPRQRKRDWLKEKLFGK